MSKKLIKSLVATILLAGCTTKLKNPSYNPLDYTKNNDSKSGAVVRLYDLKGQFFCSGTVISQKYVLTAVHCVDDKSKSVEEVEVRAVDSTISVKARVANFNERMDTALLTGDFSAFNSIPLIISLPDTLRALQASNSIVEFCGFPLGGEGICQGVQLLSQYNFWYVAKNAVMFPGMSGGPVIIDGAGIIGVNHGVYGDVLLFSPTVEIFEHLKIPVGAE